MKQCLTTTRPNGLEFLNPRSMLGYHLKLKSQASLIQDVNSLALCRHLVTICSIGLKGENQEEQSQVVWRGSSR